MDRKFELIDYRRLSRKRIISIAESLSDSYAKLYGSLPPNCFSISFDDVYDSLIYPTYGITLEEGDDLGFHNGEKILGCYEPIGNIIRLDALLNDPNDLRHHKKGFTFWHELGHALLHGEWFRTYPGTTSDKRIITFEDSLSSAAEGRREQQANLFAAHASVPIWWLNYVLKSTFDLNRPIRYIGPAKYQLYPWNDRRECRVETFQELCMDIAYLIRHRFSGMSIEVITNRIRESDYVVDVSDHRDQRTSSIPLYRTSPVFAQGALVGV